MTFDADELKNQAEELEQLLQSLRPHPQARLVSRRTMELLAVLSANQDLIDLLKKREERSLFWYRNGEYVEQRIRLTEFPAS